MRRVLQLRIIRTPLSYIQEVQHGDICEENYKLNHFQSFPALYSVVGEQLHQTNYVFETPGCDELVSVIKNRGQ